MLVFPVLGSRYCRCFVAFAAVTARKNLLSKATFFFFFLSSPYIALFFWEFLCNKARLWFVRCSCFNLGSCWDWTTKFLLNRGTIFFLHWVWSMQSMNDTFKQRCLRILLCDVRLFSCPHLCMCVCVCVCVCVFVCVRVSMSVCMAGCCWSC